MSEGKRDKQFYEQRASDEMTQHFISAAYDVRQKLALAGRMLGEELAVAHMDTTMFFEDCAYLPEWPGVPFGDEEGEIISKALGARRQNAASRPGGRPHQTDSS